MPSRSNRLIGSPADLVILDRPLEVQLDQPIADAVHTVLIGGVPVYAR